MADSTTHATGTHTTETTAADRKLIEEYKIHSNRENPHVAAVATALHASGKRYAHTPFQRIDPSTRQGPEYWGNEWNNWSGIRPTSRHENAAEGEIGYSIRILENGNPKNPESRYAVFDSANSFFTAKARTFLTYEANDTKRSFDDMITIYKSNGGSGYSAQQIADLVTSKFDAQFSLDVSKPPKFSENPELLAKLMAAHPTFESGKVFDDKQNSIFASLDGVRGGDGWQNAYLAARIGVIHEFQRRGIDNDAIRKMTADVAAEIKTRLEQEKKTEQGRSTDAPATLPANTARTAVDIAKEGLKDCTHTTGEQDTTSSGLHQCDKNNAQAHGR